MVLVAQYLPIDKEAFQDSQVTEKRMPSAKSMGIQTLLFQVE